MTGAVIRLRAADGNYLSVCNNCAALTPLAKSIVTKGNIATAHTRDGSSVYTHFRIEKLGETRFTLTSVATGERLFVCSDCLAGYPDTQAEYANSASRQILAFSAKFPVHPATSAADSSQFEMIPGAGSTVEIRSLSGSLISCRGCEPMVQVANQVTVAKGRGSSNAGTWVIEDIRPAAAAKPAAPPPATTARPAVPAAPPRPTPTVAARSPTPRPTYRASPPPTPSAPPAMRPAAPPPMRDRGMVASFPDGTVITLRSDAGGYLVPCAGCMRIEPWIAGAVSDVASLNLTDGRDPAAEFEIVDLGRGRVNLIHRTTGARLFVCSNCVSGASMRDVLAFAQDPPQGEDTFRILRMASGRYALQTDSGRYVARCRNCIRGARYPDQVTAHVDDPGAGYAQWEIREVATYSRSRRPERDDRPARAAPPAPARPMRSADRDFEPLPDDFQWAAASDPASLTLARPETDDIVWQAFCSGRTANNYVLITPGDLKFGDLTLIELRVDGGQSFTLPAKIMPLPFGEGGGVAPLLDLSLDGPEMRAMANGSYAYLTVGRAPGEQVRVRIPLINALNAFTAFSRACR